MTQLQNVVRSNSSNSVVILASIAAIVVVVVISPPLNRSQTATNKSPADNTPHEALTWSNEAIGQCSHHRRSHSHNYIYSVTKEGCSNLNKTAKL